MDKYLPLRDFIILHKQGHLEFKPMTFSDGSLVIYSNEQEAKDDAGHDGIVAEIILPPKNT